MKNKDNFYFIVLIFVSFIGSCYIFDSEFKKYSDIITFLSILVGFKITSLSILFNSPLKKELYDKANKIYGTELHRLKSFYKKSIIFDILSIVVIFIIPQKFDLTIYEYKFILGRYILILPILMGSIYWFFKIYNDLLKIFAYPTNEGD